MDDPVFCPKCLMKEVLSKVVYRKLTFCKPKMHCPVCKESYPLNATLISEDVVRHMVRMGGGACDHLLKELEKLQ